MTSAWLPFHFCNLDPLLVTPKELKLRALERQIARLGGRIEALRRLSNQYSWVRLAIVVAGVGISSLLFVQGGVLPFSTSALFWALLFGIVVWRHGHVESSLARHEGWRTLQQEQMARMRLEWEQLPPAALSPQPNHPFERDFDLVGARSLHRLLDTTVSLEGSERLRAWLTAPVPDIAQTQQRQRLVQELVPKATLRQRLALHGRLAAPGGGKWQASRLAAWAEQPLEGGALLRWLVVLSGLALLNGILFLAHSLGGLPPLWLGTFALYVALFFLQGRLLGDLFHDALTLHSSVQRLMALFRQLERYPYHDTPYLKQLCAPFLVPHQRPSDELARLGAIVSATGIRGNPFIWLALNVVGPWDYLFAYLLNRRKQVLAERLPLWLDRWFELEALSALANLAYLNPAYTFPVFTDSPPFFDATRLGHPLLPDAQKVSNDFRLASGGGHGAGDWLEHVGKELLFADCRHQSGSCLGRRAGGRRQP